LKVNTFTVHNVLNKISTDENFVNKHTHKGTLSFVNSGPHSNCTSFMFTLAENLTAFDKKYVSFGRIIQGNDVLNKIEAVAVRFERPVEHIIIEDVGVCALK
jgi:cyclophilin family peptidyl-prolyl cis-trans isomerase